jgi:hypothetical protein
LIASELSVNAGQTARAVSDVLEKAVLNRVGFRAVDSAAIGKKIQLSRQAQRSTQKGGFAPGRNLYYAQLGWNDLIAPGPFAPLDVTGHFKTGQSGSNQQASLRCFMGHFKYGKC